MSQRPHRLNDRNYERARTDKIISTRFKSLSMNDAKWVRLLDVFTEHEGLISDCRVKLVWDDQVRHMAISGMKYNFDYWPHAMEGMISGPPRGWYEYKEIEWIEFPPDDQDLVRIEAVVSNVGRFDLETADSGLRLYGYR